jgi:pimeloyl-ACP methyl ester carboxylesterase
VEGFVQVTPLGPVPVKGLAAPVEVCELVGAGPARTRLQASAVRAIRAPSLVIAGRSDLFTPPYLARPVARELADVEIEVWEETGHFPFLEHPRRFNLRD